MSYLVECRASPESGSAIMRRLWKEKRRGSRRQAMARMQWAKKVSPEVPGFLATLDGGNHTPVACVTLEFECCSKKKQIRPGHVLSLPLSSNATRMIEIAPWKGAYLCRPSQILNRIDLSTAPLSIAYIAKNCAQLKNCSAPGQCSDSR